MTAKQAAAATVSARLLPCRMAVVSVLADMLRRSGHTPQRSTMSACSLSACTPASVSEPASLAAALQPHAHMQKARYAGQALCMALCMPQTSNARAFSS